MSTAKRREGGVFWRIEYGTVPVAEMGFHSFVSGPSVGVWRDAVSEAGLGAGWMCSVGNGMGGLVDWVSIFDFDLGFGV